MARDSIIASPTNRVLVIVAEASGCCAIELNAVATERPSPSAGAITPMQIVSPEVAIDATAIVVEKLVHRHSFTFCCCCFSHLLLFSRILILFRPVLMSSCGCCNINRGQNTENIGLYHAN